VDALLWRLADGSPSILKEAGLTPRGGAVQVDEFSWPIAKKKR
jgi:hypothetical protein